ncbi:conserved hypothetical protein [Capnocytophaga canimorsus]|uniref:Uncharacterized protein n=1 Tax=Capnocytophaga canimorsus TaxID=28188 RepID=A0A0B7IBU3_9FLAO|nr:hypothetical protein [Capnocytophaga canimorsus]ATA76135.1 tetratricopeptide repeat protein [Capnocytophaga canimorsus]PJI80334.1 hypothetical protein CLV61_1188 [Capnocytophaga canimorsus]CEN35468.1 conserved hypothetical protein [Capnocytophaga canimorsus]CEN48174.1 conserved hypothetical protein [Capnocytophaga canimorsus]STA71241.1 Uncharacterised protein [Capnocytophaga canimorsus]
MSDVCISHIENYWRLLTAEANHCFNQGDYKQALDKYENALYRAEVLCNNFSDCLRLQIPFTQVYVTSCNNLIHLYEKLRQHQEVESMLKKMIGFLLFICKNSQSEQALAEMELQKSVLNYVNFIKTQRL